MNSWYQRFWSHIGRAVWILIGLTPILCPGCFCSVSIATGPYRHTCHIITLQLTYTHNYLQVCGSMHQEVTREIRYHIYYKAENQISQGTYINNSNSITFLKMTDHAVIQVWQWLKAIEISQISFSIVTWTSKFWLYIWPIISPSYRYVIACCVSILCSNKDKILILRFSYYYIMYCCQLEYWIIHNRTVVHQLSY